MIYFAIKTALSALIIVAISEIGKRSPTFAALIASLPLISLLGMIWLWRDTKDTERLAAHSEATFWYVLPSLPMFLLIPLLLRHGVSFYVAVGTSILLTILLYLIMLFIMKKTGMNVL